MNGWASILSTIAGAAMFFSKSNADNGNGNGGGKNNTSTKTDSESQKQTSPAESAYEEYKRKVAEAELEKQINDPRNSDMYFGNPTAPYDPFYDYKDDPIYNTRDSVDYPSHGNVDVVKSCRARIVSPYVLSEEVMKDGTTAEKLSVIGCKNSYMDLAASGRKYYRRYTFDEFMNEYQTSEVDGQYQRTVKLARGNFRYITFYIEILNPSKKEAEIQMCGIESVSIADEKCQPIHLGYHIPKKWLMGEEEVIGRYYMFSDADKWESDLGNVGFFSARELRTEPIRANGKIATAKWLSMGYPYVMCDSVANNGYQYQDWKEVYSGRKRTGWATEEGKKETTLVEGNSQRGEHSEDYKYDYLKVSPHSSRIVKITLPLASMDSTEAVYIPEGKLFDWDYQKNRLDHINSFDGMADSEVEISKYDQMTVNQFIDITKNYYTKMHNMMVGGYLLFDFKPAPSIVNKIVKLNITLWGNHDDYIAKNDVIAHKTDTSNGAYFELSLIPTKRPSNDKDWKKSYNDDITIPDENQSRQTQLDLINKKFDFKYEQTFADAFDASANN